MDSLLVGVFDRFLLTILEMMTTVDSNCIEFCGEIREETEKAVCVFDGIERTWIPKSVIRDRRKVDRRNSVLTIPERVAKLKGII